MEMAPIVDAVVADLRRAGAVGGDDTARVADLLVAAVEPTIRLHLLEALHAAAHELEASCPGAVVEIRLQGREPALSLSMATAEAGDAGADGATARAEESWVVFSDDELLRTTIRMPEGLKTRVEQAAAGAGASVNSYVVSALARFLEGSTGTPGAGPQPGRRMPKRMTGFVQG